MTEPLRTQLEQIASEAHPEFSAVELSGFVQHIASSTLDAVDAKAEAWGLTSDVRAIIGCVVEDLRLSLSVRTRTTEEKKNDQGSCGDTDVPPAADRNAHRRNESL